MDQGKLVQISELSRENQYLWAQMLDDVMYLENRLNEDRVRMTIMVKLDEETQFGFRPIETKWRLCILNAEEVKPWEYNSIKLKFTAYQKIDELIDTIAMRLATAIKRTKQAINKEPIADLDPIQDYNEQED